MWKANMCFQRKTTLRGSDTFSDDLALEDAKMFYEARKIGKEGMTALIAATWTDKSYICEKGGRFYARSSDGHLKKLLLPVREYNLSFYNARVSDVDEKSFHGFRSKLIRQEDETKRHILKKVQEL